MSEDGFTLAELAIAMTVTAIAGTLVAWVLLTTLSQIERAQRDADLARSALAAWTVLSDALRYPDALEIESVTGSEPAERWVVIRNDTQHRFDSSTGVLAVNERPLRFDSRSTLQAGIQVAPSPDSVRSVELTIAASTSAASTSADSPPLVISTRLRIPPPSHWPPLESR